MLKRYLLALAFTACALAQTVEPRLMLWTGNGLIFVSLPAGWSIQTDGSSGAAKLVAPPEAPPPIAVLYDDWTQLSAAQNVFTPKCALPLQLRVYRNGLRMHAGFDFDIAGASVTFKALQLGDTIELEYSCKQ